MLDCRRCKEKDCSCRTDLLRALELIADYSSKMLADEIEELLQNGLAECEDFENEDE